MEALEIYTEYRGLSTSFDLTLRLIEDLLSRRLTPEYRRLWVQGSNSGRTILVFTIFPSNGDPYRMEFLTVPNFRLFRHGGDFESEINLIEEFITGLVDDVLSGIVI